MHSPSLIAQLFEQNMLLEIARAVGTPCYVYSAERLISNYLRLKQTLAPDVSRRILYSVKANSNLAILRLLANEGAGFEVVSLGELKRVLAIGVAPERILFTGMGKREEEIAFAMEVGVGWIVVENAEELFLISNMAVERGKEVLVALRINPCIEPDTHRYLDTGSGDSKFGMSYEEALRLVASATQLSGVAIRGVHVHVGSMITEVVPYRLAWELALRFIAEARLRGCEIQMVDLGGGFAVPYQAGDAEAPLEGIAAMLSSYRETAELEIFFEPGRAIVADAGILLTQVLYNKVNAGKHYVVVDAGMNDLIRPALYGAVHGAWVVQADGHLQDCAFVTVAGPICESADILIERAFLPPVGRGDLIAISHAGAYGMSMASQYNSRARAAEVLVQDSSWRLIRPRENLESLWAEELRLLPDTMLAEKNY